MFQILNYLLQHRNDLLQDVGLGLFLDTDQPNFGLCKHSILLGQAGNHCCALSDYSTKR